MMEVQPALICIPDIKGFTEFMSDTKLELSAKVIPALLNDIIYTNSIGLKVSEIEGDAILFYLCGPPPALEDLVKQCYDFYTQFYEKVRILNRKHEHHPDSDNIPDILGLKIIMHYGKIGVNQIGKRIKLIGEDVIIAHRLLKNSIPLEEYLLISDQLMEQCQLNSKLETLLDEPVTRGSDDYEHIGVINYSYLNLKPLVA
ncbi:MAG: hypothetical protein DHS20C17_28360 [Cyclobacteriaceae bacterium]|nr:MAG: hypothetical protein DHS20C17_28360 [Cyclobacteriaceae bacterium]